MVLVLFITWVMQLFVMTMMISNVLNDHCDECGDKGIHNEEKIRKQYHVCLFYFLSNQDINDFMRNKFRVTVPQYFPLN